MCLSCDERNSSAVIGDHLDRRDKATKRWALWVEDAYRCGIILDGNVMHHPHSFVSFHPKEEDQSASLDLGSFNSLISRHSMSTD